MYRKTEEGIYFCYCNQMNVELDGPLTLSSPVDLALHLICPLNLNLISAAIFPLVWGLLLPAGCYMRENLKSHKGFGVCSGAV